MLPLCGAAGAYLSRRAGGSCGSRLGTVLVSSDRDELSGRHAYTSGEIRFRNPKERFTF